MAISSTSESDWAWLPTDLLDSILHKLASPFDMVRFGAVCKSWGTAARQGTQIPKLLVPSKDNIEKARSLYSITDRTISDVTLPVPYNRRRCCGSSFGWLSFVTNTSSIILFNPFRNKKIRLPQLQKLTVYTRKSGKQYTVKKVTLSSDPAEDSDCLVVAIFGEFSDLVFMKLGDESWTYVEHEYGHLFSDVLYYKGQVLAIDHRSELISLDVNTNKKNVLAPQDLEHAYQTYLVETSNGDLFLLRRFFDEDSLSEQIPQSITGYFTVHKLVLDDESGRVVERVEVKNIGDDAFFVGDNQSISISTSDFPYCQPNSIYYTDDYIFTRPYFPDGAIDMGIFNLKDRSIRLHYKPNPSHKYYMPPPIWILLPML
ncbi:F-box protein At2g17036-like [Corylus avellana]|uniref:F-box protein At2g17036-like n=1 Tax=Corylus avellana TaxID=13451 RepID=UPI00286BF1E2|nr:F-box protein At2g17036-like [Corylus avellana]